MSRVEGLVEFREYLQRKQYQDKAVQEFWSQLEKARQVKKFAVGQWYCKKAGCNLATAVAIEGQVIMHVSPYKLSPKALEVGSSEDGRKANMNDAGYWDPQTFLVPRGWDEAVIDIQCHHAVTKVPFNDLIALGETVLPGHAHKFTV